jgi:putative tryptophan/tyrosine transport system permease protein
MELGANLLIIGDAVAFNSTGLLFVVLGVFVLIRMAGFPDLTVDGSFTIGAALYSVCLIGGLNTPLALLVAGIGGATGGFLTWMINDRFGVGKVVSSVLSMIILILTAPYIAGGSTKSLLNVISFHSRIDTLDARISQAIIGTAPYQTHIVFSLVWLSLFGVAGTAAILVLRTRPGLRFRYGGSAASPTLVPKPERRRLLLCGLVAGNAIVGVGGAIEAQRRGGFTNNMGTGMLLVALAVLVLGEALVKSFRKREYLTMSEYSIAVVIGCFVYSAGIQGLLALHVDFVDLRLLTAIFLLLLLGIAGQAHSSSTRLF